MTRTVIAGGLVVDGSGREPYAADVLVDGDRIVQVGPNLSREADVVVDAGGRVVSPGFIDLHCHYDAQVFWDPMLSSSCHHGVTSVINGNCGFSLAPYSRENRPIVIKMLRDLEDMYTDTLELAAPDHIESFASYMADVKKSGPMLNFGSFLGHSTVRIAVMGQDSYERAATPEEIAAMVKLVDGAMEAGAMGFASKTSGNAARPAPSLLATDDETMTLLRAFGAHKRGIGMFSPGSDAQVERVYTAQAEIGRPFTWIALLELATGSHHTRRDMHRRWYERGAQVRPQVSCRPLTTMCRMSLPSALRAQGLTDLNHASDAERLAAYASPEWRKKVEPTVESILGTPMNWELVSIAESPSAPETVGRDLVSLGKERGKLPFDVLMDMAVADGLETKLVIINGNGDVDEVTKLLNLEGAVLGLSDAGAHPGQICDAVMPTDLLGNWVRDRGTMSLEAGVHKLTQEPAELLGLQDRGVVAPGYFADLVVFDPKTVGPGPLTTAFDLPAGRERLLADKPTGMHHIMVNGIATRQNETTRRVQSGRLLRPH